MWFLTFLLVILLDCVVFSVPVLIYRFVIRKGERLQDRMKAVFVNFSFFLCGVIVLAIINALAGSYDDPDYRFHLGIVDAIFWAVDFAILTTDFGKKSLPNKYAKQTSNPVVPPAKCCYCGAPLSPNAKFCAECGKKVVPSGMTVCPSCNNTVVSGKFCPECGHQLISFLSEMNSPEPSSPQPVTQVKSTSPPRQLSKLEQIMKSQFEEEQLAKILQEEEEQRIKRTNTVVLIVGISVFVLIGIIVALSTSYINGYWA